MDCNVNGRRCAFSIWPSHSEVVSRHSVSFESAEWTRIFEVTGHSPQVLRRFVVALGALLRRMQGQGEPQSPKYQSALILRSPRSGRLKDGAAARTESKRRAREAQDLVCTTAKVQVRLCCWPSGMVQACVPVSVPPLPVSVPP